MEVIRSRDTSGGVVEVEIDDGAAEEVGDEEQAAAAAAEAGASSSTAGLQGTEPVSSEHANGLPQQQQQHASATAAAAAVAAAADALAESTAQHLSV